MKQSARPDPALALACLLLAACAGTGERPYFIRSVGGYYDPATARFHTPPNRVPEAERLQMDAASLTPSRSALKETADSYLGVPYRFGGTTRGGMDCSGFIQRVFAEAGGLKLPRNTRAMYREGSPVARSDLRLGDVVFFRRLTGIFHAGIYIGGGYFIHSSSTHGVTYTHLQSPYFDRKYAGAKRFID